MGSSRRKFLKASALSAVCAGVPGIVSNVSAATNSLPTGELLSNIPGSTTIYSKASFMPCLNTKFRIHAGALETRDVTLTKITDFKEAATDPTKIAGQESFALLFKDSHKSSPLTQGSYVLEHDVCGKFVLFIVPIGKRENGQYQAIITR